MTDWPDPRFPERNISPLEIGIVSAVVFAPTALYLWGLIAPIIRLLLSSLGREQMANSSDTGCGTLIAIAAIAFFVGRASVSEKATRSEPPSPTAQQFIDAPVADPQPAPSTRPVYSAPQRFAEPSAYYRNCSAARAAGAAPVMAGDPGYAPHLDRDGDGVGCE